MDLNNKKRPDDVKLLRMPALPNGFYILDTLGSGSFGIVQQCLKVDTKEIVALKILSKVDGQKELDILEALREIGQDKNNFVRFNGHLTHCDKVLLEFEKLDKTLFDWIGMSGGKGRPLSEIQAITKQLLVSLTALKSLKMVHADIKPNNIMLVDQQRQPSKVKLIDFGMATRVSELETGHNFQIIGFRAPEVMLGLPLNEAMDMWSLGCIVAYLYLGTCLYKLGTCKYQAMKNLVKINGQPNDNLLNSGRCTNVFFTKTKYIEKQWWSLKEHCCCEECAVPGRKRTKSSQSSKGSPASSTIQKPGQFTSLDDIVLTRPGAAENEDTQAFLSLLKKMLHLDAKKRIDPSEALRHPFMTMKHFPSECVSNPDMPSVPGRRRVRRLAGCNAKGNKTCVVGVKERYDSSAITSKAEASPKRARGGRGEKISCIDKRVKGDAEINTRQKHMKNFPSECVSNPDMPSAPRRRRVRPSAGCNSKGNKTCVVGVKESYDSSPNTSKAEASPERARGGHGEKISCTKKRTKGDAEISPRKKSMKNLPSECVSNPDMPSAPSRRRVRPKKIMKKVLTFFKGLLPCCNVDVAD
ncbi:unnamed protein product [Pleuronectes platessa]|uniref:Protein kinase domain-containing protein n=1 Tax=Pleuronectes platessa TaxID=8262 RepID=A0A9N7YNT4_PLEPL|nr:unnamed protein product [Pleuronectes platessa]